MATARKTNFTNVETDALMQLYTSQEIQVKFLSCKKSHRAVWEIIANELVDKGFSLREWQQCRDRITNLKRLYLSYKRAIKSGASPPTWPYFNAFNKLFGQTARGSPVSIVESLDSMADSIHFNLRSHSQINDETTDSDDIEAIDESVFVGPARKKRKRITETSEVEYLVNTINESFTEEREWRMRSEDKHAEFLNVLKLIGKDIAKLVPSSPPPRISTTQQPEASCSYTLLQIFNTHRLSSFRTCVPCPVKLAKDDSEDQFDAAVVITPSIKNEFFSGSLSKYLPLLQQYKEVDDSWEQDASVHFAESLPIKRLIYSPIGPVDRDYDDVRRVFEASCKGIKKAIAAGSRKPLLSLPSGIEQFRCSDLVAILGALHATYVPLEIRESVPSRATKIDDLTLIGFTSSTVEKTLKIARALEFGKSLCRDIGGSDPERMAPPLVTSYVQDAFLGTAVKVEVIDDENTLLKDYPLFAAVNRAAKGVDRHRGRIIYLTYEPEGPVDTTVLLVGKGVTYDTGGADIKAGGCMAGMHRDKCGAASVAGFFQVLAQLKPKGIKVIGGMAMVRNSVGSNCYVADELITSRAGVRVRVGNTDAEGRMAMTDLLYHMKEKAVQETNPYLFTIATLTGHAVLTVGQGYSIILDNGPARKEEVAQNIQKAGDLVGDMFEISTLRREDYEFTKGKSEYEDLLQCNNAPSSRTPRGHQFPAAFMIIGSGLDKHGINSSHPLRYSHIDIAAADGPFPGIPSGSPVSALAAHFVMSRI